MKKFISFLRVWDGIWSVPLAILIFSAVGYSIISLFGPEVGAMYPVYIQRLFYAALCMVICNFLVLFGIYMNFRGVFKYYLEDLKSDFNSLDPHKRVKLMLIVYFSYALLFTMFLILV